MCSSGMSDLVWLHSSSCWCLAANQHKVSQIIMIWLIIRIAQILKILIPSLDLSFNFYHAEVPFKKHSIVSFIHSFIYIYLFIRQVNTSKWVVELDFVRINLYFVSIWQLINFTLFSIQKQLMSQLHFQRKLLWIYGSDCVWKPINSDLGKNEDLQSKANIKRNLQDDKDRGNFENFQHVLNMRRSHSGSLIQYSGLVFFHWLA